VQIAFANQMAEVARSVGVDPFSLIKLANHHPRVNILNPGIGVGGDCVPVHPLFLKSHDNSLPSLIKEAININSQQEDMVVQEVLSSVQRFKKLHKKSKPKVLLLGLTYKPNVADIRNAPAIRIAKRLAQEEGLQLKVYDPMLDSNQIKKIGFVHLEALSDYKTMDLVVFLVAHAKFNQIRELNDLPEGSLVDPIGFMRACETLPPMREATTD